MRNTLEQYERHLKVVRNMLTEYQDRLNVVNAEIDAEEEESWELNQMKTEKAQLRYDIEATAKDIAHYVELLTQGITVDYDSIESYIREAQRDLTFAKGQEPGSSYEAENLEKAHAALKNAITVLGRAMPSPS